MEIRPNKAKQKLAAGGTVCVIGGITDPDDIDQFGPEGFDAVWLEGEHGPIDFADLGNLTRACDLWGMTPIVRLNCNRQSLIYRTLDRGAQGIVMPHVDTRKTRRWFSQIDRHHQSANHQRFLHTPID